jgi:hypothetical protein
MGPQSFSEIDFNKAFHQLELEDEDSKNITTVETQRGPLRFKVLHMGVHNASEIFQNVIQHKVLRGLKGVRNIADNIIVFGKTREEHDDSLVELCKRLEQSGLTASAENCTLGVEKLTFFGLNLSKDGVAVNEDKVMALIQAGPPKTAGELRSYLGLALYCSAHIPDLATLAEPLWELLKEGVSYTWEAKQQTAFKAIKEALITKSLSYFNTKFLTQVTVDVSPVGLGAVLGQVNPKNLKDKHIVMYISRLLSDIEQRYSQVEKEALAVVWACERLYLYLFGNEFELITDNRAVELIFSNPKSDPPLRIKRWALRLMDYNYKITHKPGKYNIADYLSRNPLEITDVTGQSQETENYVAFISEHAIPKAFQRDEIIAATATDLVLQRLISSLRNERGKVIDDELMQIVKCQFLRVMGELSVTADGLVMRG